MTSAEHIAERASRLLIGWDAEDLLAYDVDQWDDIPWKHFHAMLYRFERFYGHDGSLAVNLSPARELTGKVYTSDKWGPFIQSLRHGMWTLLEPSGFKTTGITYIALSGLPGIRRRWTFPLYTNDPFTPGRKETL
jgi:hypothetical protein